MKNEARCEALKEVIQLLGRMETEDAMPKESKADESNAEKHDEDNGDLGELMRALSKE